MKFCFKIYISLISSLFVCNSAKSQNWEVSLGTGFGYENKIIEALENDFFYLDNRTIVYVQAVEFKAGLNLYSLVDFGMDISYTWAALNWLPQSNVFGPTINNIGWASIGGWVKYILLPQNRLQFAIMASTGAHIGYPKRMNVDTIERHVAFYAGLHGGPQYKISDKFMVSYYYGRGKFRNMILLTYSL